MLTKELKNKIEAYLIEKGLSKSKIEQELNMPKNCLSNFLSFKKIMPSKWVIPLENLVGPKTDKIEAKNEEKIKLPKSNKKQDGYTYVPSGENIQILDTPVGKNDEFGRLINLFNTIIVNKDKNSNFLDQIISLKNEVKKEEIRQKLNYNQINSIIDRCNNVISGKFVNKI